MNFVAALFRPAQPIPIELRSNFSHLFQDIFWFGILNGSAIGFISIYATHLGATGQQIGFLSAAPAVINLLFAIPVGRWLQKRNIGKAVFGSALVHRFMYLSWMMLPWFFNQQMQIWGIVLTTLVMSIPGTGLAVGFNALFADTVPPEWRGHVAGIRNVILSVSTTVTALICGWILVTLPFSEGYQVVFGIGFLGALLSSLHLYFLKPYPLGIVPPRLGQALGEFASPGVLRTSPESFRSGVGLRFLTRSGPLRLLRAEILEGPFGKVVGLLFLFHLAQYLSIPVIPVFMVNVLNFSDQVISIGNATFFLTVLVGSTQLAQLSSRWGHKKVTGVGITLLATFPLLMTISSTVPMFMVTHAVAGIAWALAGGALPNYLLENVPADDRPAYLAWYNIGLNAAILMGSLGGPAIANLTGLSVALVIFGLFRVLAGTAVLKWG